MSLWREPASWLWQEDDSAQWEGGSTGFDTDAGGIDRSVRECEWYGCDVEDEANRMVRPPTGDWACRQHAHQMRKGEHL